MANVLSEDKKQQVIALGRLGWSLRRIERETGVRRETAGLYLRAAGVAVRSAGWGGKPRAKPAIEVTTDFGPGKAAISVPAGADPAKPAVQVTTDSEASSTGEQARNWLPVRNSAAAESVSECLRALPGADRTGLTRAHRTRRWHRLAISSRPRKRARSRPTQHCRRQDLLHALARKVPRDRSIANSCDLPPIFSPRIMRLSPGFGSPRLHLWARCAASMDAVDQRQF
jgi:hypothetical protein